MAQSFRTAISFDGLASASSQAIAVKVDGDSENRILVDAGGKITWGAGGSSAGDTTLYRNAANVLKTDDGFVAASVTVPDGGLTLGSTAVTSTAAELNILDGVTATASELNILDGVTSTTSELNILDGVTSTASELNLVDGITAGTVSASLAVIADSNKDVTGFRNVTLTGELDAATLDISGNADIDGTTNLDDVDIDGTVQIDGAVTVGVDDTGVDVKFFGATSGKYMLWDESADSLIVKDTVDAVNFKVNGGQGSDGQVLTSTGSGVAWENASGGGGGSPGGSDHQVQFNDNGSFGADANFTYDGSNLTAKVPFTVGVDDTGHDVKFFGAASGAHLLWDESNNRLDVVTSSGAAYFRSLNGTATTYIGSDSGNTALFGTSSAHDTRFITNDTERIRILSNGNVGIGASNPTSFFVVNGVSQFDGALNVGVNDTGHDVIFYGATADNSWFWWDESDDALKLGPSSPLYLDGVKLTEGSADTLRIDSGDGTVDIGAMNTSGIHIYTDTENFFFGTTPSGGSLDVDVVITDSAMYPYDNNDLDLGLSNKYWKRIYAYNLYLADTTDTGSDTSDGALVIGATTGQHLSFDTNEILSKSDDSTMGDLHLQTDGGDIKFGNNTALSHFRIHASSGATEIHSTASALELHNTTAGDQSVYHAYYDDSGTRYGYIGYPANDDMYFKNENAGGQMYSFAPGSYMYWHVGGAYELRLSSSELRPYSNEGLNLGASGAAWNHFYLGQASTFSSGGYYTLRSRDSDRQVMELTSSERFKKDIVDLPLDEAYQVLNARPIKYRGVEDDSSVPLEAGLSAESLHNAGYEYAVRYDEGHWGTTPRSIYYEYLTAPLIKICKDQKDRIESLEAKVAALESA